MHGVAELLDLRNGLLGVAGERSEHLRVEGAASARCDLAERLAEDLLEARVERQGGDGAVSALGGAT